MVYPEPNTGCWLWIGAQHPQGHGSLNGPSHNGFNYAHRYSYFLQNGEFDRSMMVCHKCDVPSCVNPEHLYLGTAKDNMRDILERGNPKYAVGDQVHTTKLTPDLVREIRLEYKTGKHSMRKLGRKYGVAHGTISDLLSGFRWGHIS